MRVRRDDTLPGFRLLDEDREIGWIRGDTVSFTGFPERVDAAMAAAVAHHALVQRRGASVRADGLEDGFLIVSREEKEYVVAPSSIAGSIRQESAPGPEHWAFDVELSRDEIPDVFAIARARVIWAALRTAGLHRRMRQLIPVGISWRTA